MISGASQADIGVLVSLSVMFGFLSSAYDSFQSFNVIFVFLHLSFMPITQVISARKGEFETGYEKGGQTREHVQLAKTLGVAKLLVVVNKMDDPTVNWSKERFCLSLSLFIYVCPSVFLLMQL